MLAVLLVISLGGCKVTQRISEGAFRNAVSDGTVAELKERGIRLTARPSCRTQAIDKQSVMRVNCTARTRTGQPVAVAGVATDADTAHPREQYVVTVGGRDVLRQDCLGLGCA